VTSRVTGAITQAYYREEKIVHKGGQLLEIDPRPFQAALTDPQDHWRRIKPPCRKRKSTESVARPVLTETLQTTSQVPIDRANTRTEWGDKGHGMLPNSKHEMKKLPCEGILQGKQRAAAISDNAWSTDAKIVVPPQ